MKISLSELDRQRFGVITAKANLEAGDELQSVITWCQQNAADMLITRIPTDEIALAQDMEQAGFLLTDTLVYFRNKKLTKMEEQLPEGYSWRLADSHDVDAVGELAQQTFIGYSGHYHADQKLNKQDCDLVYSSWAANSCQNKQLADVVILVMKDEQIAAFATVKKVEIYMCEGVLFGVSPDHQGRSLYSALMTLAQNWAIDCAYTQMIVSTQVTNLAVQKVWCRQGFEPYKSFYTFHKWFK